MMTVLDVAKAFGTRFPLVSKASVILMWVFSAFAVAQCVRHFAGGGQWGQDAHAYWAAVQGPLEYRAAPGQADAFLYSPAFAAIIRPLGLLPWPYFCAVWVLVELGALVWLIKPLPLRWAIPVALTCTPELVVGNIYLLLAVAIVLGLRFPAMWAFPILTKVTVGVGLLWHAARRDWAAFTKGIAATFGVVLVFFAFDPAAWISWFTFLRSHSSGTPDTTVSFVIRSILAIAVTLFAARRGWAILVPIGALLATPVLVWPIPLMLLAAIPRILALENGGGLSSAGHSEAKLDRDELHDPVGAGVDDPPAAEAGGAERPELGG